MDQRLQDVLHGQVENRLLPFFWQRGDHTARIPEQIQQIYDSGCRAFCVESRPHPDFVGDGWWRDMDVILAEAARREMQVWVLDDDHFPTGHAAGAIAREHPELRQWELVERHLDVAGPAPDTAVLVDEETEDHRLLGVYAYRRLPDDEETCTGEPVELTGHLHGHYLTWDVPDGIWRVFFYYHSRKGGRPEYIDMINPASVRVLIEAVYEPHYARYKDYFGNTLAGFFSDEPCFGNGPFGPLRCDEGGYEARIGKPSLALPWNDTVRELMTEKLGYDPLPYLQWLWYPDDRRGDSVAPLRHAYMDTVTALYSQCFNRQLADWCHAHGVQYIGHIVEDMNCRMGMGAGHYFRALQWQDMSGIDIVLHQVMPGLAHTSHPAAWCGTVGGPFFHYILGKLGASLAHLTPHMEGRAMCEVFGAYGYGEDSPLMKYLIDFLLVRGINHFVPHAFGTKFPDGDCPPHFGAEGMDPSFEAFTALMDYTNKAAHLLEGATHKANAAILYHVDGEWASRYKNASTMEPLAMALYDNHIDFDIVTADLLKDARVEAGKLCIHRETFECLAVPYADHLPKGLLDTLQRLQEAGLMVRFERALPENAAFAGVAVTPTALVAEMRQKGMTDVLVEQGYPELRVYHAVREGRDLFMFANEHVGKRVDTVVALPCTGAYARLDLLTESAVSGETADGTLSLTLEPGQSQFVVFGSAAGLPTERRLTREVPVAPRFTLELASCEDMTRFAPAGTFEEYFNVNGPDFQPDFCGKMRYTFTFTVEDIVGRVYLDLGRVGQNARLAVNGVDCGIRISRPYLYDVTDAVAPGVNTATVVVSNTLVRRERDYFSRFLPLAPAGLLGEVMVRYEALDAALS